jgi:uncharacterized protein YjbI with pentapeptide repeats
MRRCNGLALGCLLLAFTTPAMASCQDPSKARVDWTGCHKPQLMLGNDDLTGAVFAKASLNGTDFAGAKLAGAKFAEAELSFVKFAGADLSGADFTKAVAWRANFTKAKLEKANFTTAQTSRSLFVQALLARHQLHQIGGQPLRLLRRRPLRRRHVERGLARANFINAKLAGVKFEDSNLGRARLKIRRRPSPAVSYPASRQTPAA